MISFIGLLVFFSQTVLAATIELPLENCISLALKNNPSIKAAVEDKERYSWGINEAIGNKNPSLVFTHTDDRKRAAISNASSSGELYNLFTNQFTFSLPLYSGGKYENAIDEAKLNYKVSELTLASVKQQIKFNVTANYCQVLQYRNLVKADQESVDDYALHLRNLQASYETGSASKLQVLQTKVSLANAQQTLIKDQNNYHVALINLNNVIGLPRDTEVVPKEDLKYEKNSMSIEECVNYAMENHPEMIIYKNNIAIAEDNVKIAKSGYLPTVSLDGYDAWQSTHLPGTKYNYFSVYLVTSFNIFDSGVTRSKVKEASAALHKAQETAKQESDTVYANVNQYYLSMREAEKRIETCSVSVEEAEEALMITMARFQAGLGTNQDVLDQEVALSTAKNNYIQALYDYNTDKAGLEAAMGVVVN